MQIAFWIFSVLISMAIGYAVFLADRKRSVPYPLLTASLRVLLVFGTFLLLFAPALTVDKQVTHEPLVLFLQDNSKSVGAALKADSSEYKKAAQSLIAHLGKKYKVVQWGFGERIQRDSLFDYRQQATNISEALSQAVGYYGEQNLGAIILATDGRINEGANPLISEIPYTGVLYCVAIGDSSQQKDVRIARLYANKTVPLGSQFEIRADFIALAASGYHQPVRLLNDKGDILSTAAVDVSTERFDRSLSFTVKAEKAGLHQFTIEAPAADGEQNKANNRRSVFVEVVAEQKNILIAANAPHPDVNAIREALSGYEGYKVVVKTADRLPSSFDDYQLVILHSLPSPQYPLPQLAKVHKPMWLIMGANSSNAAFNQLQSVAEVNVNPANLRNYFAVYNSGFRLFSLPANIQAVMDKMPPLSVPAGFVKPSPTADILFTAKENPAMPLWMLQQGTTPSALTVGEGLWRWRLFEFKNFGSHHTVDALIRQTVSLLAASVKDRPFQVVLPKFIWNDREPITLNAYLLNANNEQTNEPAVSLSLTDSSGKVEKYSLESYGNAYRLNLGIRAPGSYRYVATVNYQGKHYTATGSFAVAEMPLEAMETGADYPFLYHLARKYNGSMVPSFLIGSLYDSLQKNDLMKPVIQTETQSVPLIDWKWYFLVLLLIATAEWLLRKYWMAQ